MGEKFSDISTVHAGMSVGGYDHSPIRAHCPAIRQGVMQTMPKEQGKDAMAFPSEYQRNMRRKKQLLAPATEIVARLFDLFRTLRIFHELALTLVIHRGDTYSGLERL